MGACVMGFDATKRAVGDALEKEIKRVVQVIEAYPDTGRRVFQTVLTEFEKFLEHFFRNDPPTEGFSERCYYHEMTADASGDVYAALAGRWIAYYS